jgi:NADPH:quinone reductase-like Zn-dependent oxidoreductase
MKAVRIHEYGGPEKLTFEENVPDPVMQSGSILIETAAASVNPIDWKVRSGARQKDVPLSLPAILGRDVSGVVRSVAADVPNFRVGDRVLALTRATYAGLVVAPHSIVTHLPEGVDLVDAAAIPLISLTGDQLVRYATAVRSGETIIVTGALGSVGRAAVHAARKLGARVIAGVRGRQMEQARSLGIAEVVAIDDDQAIAKLEPVDAVADTVGGETGAKLFAKVRKGGSFGYASTLPVGTAEMNPTVKLARVSAQPDPSKVREFADDLRDGNFVLPIGLRLPLRAAAQAHILGERGGIGKILLLAHTS